MNHDISELSNLQTKNCGWLKNASIRFSFGTIMISEQVFYLFLFPWIVFIAAVPASVMTYIFAGLAAQLLNYLPEKTAGER